MAERLLLALALTASAAPLWAKDVVIQMRNKGAEGLMVFEPSFVSASIGDTVRFVPTDPGHNAEPIAGMLPAGVALPAGKMSQEYSFKVTRPGLYGFKCLPHFGMGMVALVQAGKGPPPNLAQAKAASLPPLAAKRMGTLFAQVK